MAGIERNLVLKDKFSSVFDKFIKKMEKANQAAEEQEKQANKVDRTWRKYTKSLSTEYSGILGKLDKAQQAVDVFAATFGEESSYAIKAQEKFNKLLEKSGMSFDDMKAKMLTTHKAFKGLGSLITAGIGKIGSLLLGSVDLVNEKFLKTGENIKNLFSQQLARLMTSFFKGTEKGFKRLEQALKSPAVQNAIKVLQVLFEAVGAAVGSVAEIVAEFVETLGENINRVSDHLAGAFEFIGGLFGVFRITVHNVVASIWNVIASVAEFIGNVFNDPVGAIVRLFISMGDVVLDIIKSITKAIDKIFNKNWTASIQGFQDDIHSWANEKFGAQGLVLERMELEGYDQVEKYAAAGRQFGERLSAANIAKETLNSVKNIEGYAGGMYDALTDEDLQMLIDMATQKFVSNVNLTAQTPVITINGANTGNTDADRRALANTIKDILVEQIASGSTSGQYAYAGA